MELTNPSGEEDAGLRSFLGEATSPSSNEVSRFFGGVFFTNATQADRGRGLVRQPRGAEFMASAIQHAILASRADQGTVNTIFGGEFLGALQPLLAIPQRELGDYAFGNISNIIDQLVANDPNSSQAPTPASKTAVKRLCTRITVEKSHVDDGWECAIHKEPFGIGEVATRLPCGHIFLEDAIHRWLDEHHSCPVCRFSLPTDDEEEADQQLQRDAADAVAAEQLVQATAAAPAASAGGDEHTSSSSSSSAPSS